MTDNQKRGAAIGIILLLAFSIIAFALPFEKNAVFIISYLFGLLAIVVQFYVMKLAFKDGQSVRSRFYGIPIARISLICMAAQLIISLISMAFSGRLPIWAALMIDVILFAVGAIGLIGADTIRDEIRHQEMRHEIDTVCMTRLKAITAALPDQCSNKEAKKELEKLVEAFRYSDPVSSEGTAAVEAELEKAVSELESIVVIGNFGQIAESSGAVMRLLAYRNRQCKLAKH